ncbi:MAG: SHOCT domain-containing protein [Acidimicrobiia bacterium]
MSTLLDIAARGAEHAGRAGGWGGPWWPIFPILWITLAATVIWLLVRRRGGRSETPSERAVGILSARYARGEIDTEEYRRRLDEIRGLA